MKGNDRNVSNKGLVGGFDTSEKYEFVSWDDDIPNKWKVIKTMFQTTNQYYNTILYGSILLFYKVNI